MDTDNEPWLPGKQKNNNTETHQAKTQDPILEVPDKDHGTFQETQNKHHDNKPEKKKTLRWQRSTKK